MPKSFEEPLMIEGDEDSFDVLFDKLVSFVCVSGAEPDSGRPASWRWSK